MPGDPPEDYHVKAADAEAIGREIRGARDTVPASQARALRDVRIHWKSCKTVDWLYFIVSLAEIVLAGRLRDVYYEVVMFLVKSCRLIFRPSALSQADVTAIKPGPEKCCASFYNNVYRHDPARLKLCRLPIATQLDIVPGILSCGPVWVWWQFPIERAIGTLGVDIKSWTKPHASLTNAISCKYEAELLTALGETFCPSDWARATEVPVASDGVCGSFAFPPGEDADVHLLPPRSPPAELMAPELEHLQTALRLEGVLSFPEIIVAKKYARLQLSWVMAVTHRHVDHRRTMVCCRVFCGPGVPRTRHA